MHVSQSIKLYSSLSFQRSSWGYPNESQPHTAHKIQAWGMIVMICVCCFHLVASMLTPAVECWKFPFCVGEGVRLCEPPLHQKRSVTTWRKLSGKKHALNCGVGIFFSLAFPLLVPNFAPAISPLHVPSLPSCQVLPKDSELNPNTSLHRLGQVGMVRGARDKMLRQLFIPSYFASSDAS